MGLQGVKMTEKEFNKMKFYKNQKLYWLGDIERTVLAVDFTNGKIEFNDGDIHHFSQINKKKV